MRLAILAIFSSVCFSSICVATPVTMLDIYAVYTGISTVPSFLAIPVGTEPAVMPVTWPGATGGVGDLDALEESLLVGNQLCMQSPGCVNTIANPLLTGPNYYYEFATAVPPSTFWFSAATGPVSTPTWLSSADVSTLEDAGLMPSTQSDPLSATPEPSTIAACAVGFCVLGLLAQSRGADGSV